MNTNRFFLKYGDTKMPVNVKLNKNIDGCVVNFIMTDWKRNNVIIDDIAEITNPSKGEISYSFKSNEIMGDFKAEFEIKYPDGKNEIYPQQGFILISVSENLRKDIVVTVDGGTFTEEPTTIYDGGEF